MKKAIFLGVFVMTMAGAAFGQNLPPPLIPPTASPPAETLTSEEAAPTLKIPRVKKPAVPRRSLGPVANEQKPETAGNSPSAPIEPARPTMTRCEGQLAKVDPGQVTITNFATNQTCILKRGDVSLADLKAGDEVVAEMDADTETMKKLSRK